MCHVAKNDDVGLSQLTTSLVFHFFVDQITHHSQPKRDGELRPPREKEDPCIKKAGNKDLSMQKSIQRILESFKRGETASSQLCNCASTLVSGESGVGKLLCMLTTPIQMKNGSLNLRIG
jgi:hypothetical protein